MMAGFKNMTEAVRAVAGDEAARAYERKLGVLDWLEERGFTEDERRRVAAALAPPLRSFVCSAGEEHQISFPECGEGWAMNVHLRTSKPMTVHLFGVFEPTSTEEAP